MYINDPNNIQGIIHINKPEVIETSIRLLPKHKRKFIDLKFSNLKQAIDYGLENYKYGFRIYRQNCHEWYEPTYILLVKIEDLKRELV